MNADWHSRHDLHSRHVLPVNQAAARARKSQLSKHTSLAVDEASRGSSKGTRVCTAGMTCMAGIAGTPCQ